MTILFNVISESAQSGLRIFTTVRTKVLSGELDSEH